MSGVLILLLVYYVLVDESMGAMENSKKLGESFTAISKQFNLRGILGVSRYEPVYNALMPVQKKYLEKITGNSHYGLLETGYIVTIAYIYPDRVIQNIGLTKNGDFDKDSWNIYSHWYKTLNHALNETSKRIAETLNGIPLPATSEGMSETVKSVKEYYPTVVSHRVHAEESGVGWRGRNSLIVNPDYSCMIRLAGVITSTPLHITPKLDANCGTCTSCLEACSFLRHKDRLGDYREQCLAYMNWLDLDEEVCGKCIKACVNSPRMNLRTYSNK